MSMSDLAPKFIKDGIPYGLIAYLVINAHAPKFNQAGSLDMLKQSFNATQQVSKLGGIGNLTEMIQGNLSGFNNGSQQGIGSFFKRVMSGEPGVVPLNYGYNYMPKGPHTRWH